MWVRSLASFSGLRIWHCHELLWCRSQTRLGSGIAVAVVQASGCSSDLTPNLGKYAAGVAVKRQKKKERKKRKPPANQKKHTTQSKNGQITEIFHKRKYTGNQQTCRNPLIHQLLGRPKLKPKWLKFKRLKIINVGETVKPLTFIHC